MYELKKINEDLYRIIKDNEVAGWAIKCIDNLWYVKIIGTEEVIKTDLEQVKDYLQGIG